VTAEVGGHRVDAGADRLDDEVPPARVRGAAVEKEERRALTLVIDDV